MFGKNSILVVLIINIFFVSPIHAEELDITEQIKKTKLSQVISEFPNKHRKILGPKAIGKIDWFRVNCDTGDVCAVKGRAVIEKTRVGSIDLTMTGEINRKTCILKITDYTSNSMMIRLIKKILGNKVKRFVDKQHEIRDCESFL